MTDVSCLISTYQWQLMTRRNWNYFGWARVVARKIEKPSPHFLDEDWVNLLPISLNSRLCYGKSALLMLLTFVKNPKHFQPKNQRSMYRTEKELIKRKSKTLSSLRKGLPSLCVQWSVDTKTVSGCLSTSIRSCGFVSVVSMKTLKSYDNNQHLIVPFAPFLRDHRNFFSTKSWRKYLLSIFLIPILLFDFFLSKELRVCCHLLHFSTHHDRRIDQLAGKFSSVESRLTVACSEHFKKNLIIDPCVGD